MRLNVPDPSASIQSAPAVPPRYRFQRAGSAVLRPITHRSPGPKARWLTWPQGRARGTPPSAAIVKA